MALQRAKSSHFGHLGDDGLSFEQAVTDGGNSAMSETASYFYAADADSDSSINDGALLHWPVFLHLCLLRNDRMDVVVLWNLSHRPIYLDF
jgi:hypothetical protein